MLVNYYDEAIVRAHSTPLQHHPKTFNNELEHPEDLAGLEINDKGSKLRVGNLRADDNLILS